MTLTHFDVQQRFEEETARLDKVIYIAGAMGDLDRVSDELEEFLDEIHPADVVRMWGALPSSVAESLEAGDTDELAAWLFQQDALGWLLKFCTPAARHDGVGMSFSWGVCHTQWVYGETFEAALDLGFKWVAERRAFEVARDRQADRKAAGGRKGKGRAK